MSTYPSQPWYRIEQNAATTIQKIVRSVQCRSNTVEALSIKPIINKTLQSCSMPPQDKKKPASGRGGVWYP
jgi:hypothetical protein